jgi:8-oxo-dGTP pyrophosphatase MutT (NUDIX family)
MNVIVPKDAATIMLLRDAPPRPEAPGDDARMQVLMLRRNAHSTWAGGISLFPGGAVDDADRGDEIAAFCRGQDDASASRVLGLEQGGLSHFVAAVRECFEEAGVLLAAVAGRTLSFVDAEVAGRFEEHRRRLNEGSTTLADICAAEALTLELGRLRYFSHWITPEGSARRYDTRFFAAAVPDGQQALHDDDEVVASVWIEPEKALRLGERGDMDLWLPTIKNLEAIAMFGTATALMAAPVAATVPVVLPRVTVDGEAARILLPGDEGYDEATGLLPGVPFPASPR